jgi:hypothetical protein
MPPKGGAKGGGKKKGGGDDDDDGAPSGTCNQIKVRHILCEKHGKVRTAARQHACVCMCVTLTMPARSVWRRSRS